LNPLGFLRQPGLEHFHEFSLGTQDVESKEDFQLDSESQWEVMFRRAAPAGTVDVESSKYSLLLVLMNISPFFFSSTVMRARIENLQLDANKLELKLGRKQ
jgi:hypothetical protein